MREYVEHFNNLVRRMFGDEARFDGAIGTERRPGEIRIVCRGRVLGRGPTFKAALQDAQRTAAKENTAV
jgi:hypothetical protein